MKYLTPYYKNKSIRRLRCIFLFILVFGTSGIGMHVKAQKKSLFAGKKINFRTFLNSVNTGDTIPLEINKKGLLNFQRKGVIREKAFVIGCGNGGFLNTLINGKRGFWRPSGIWTQENSDRHILHLELVNRTNVYLRFNEVSSYWIVEKIEPLEQLSPKLKKLKTQRRKRTLYR